ncbi:Telomere end binding protein [Penicillium brevicompactum]|uniref:Telomere end binding protein n=1 Tax=Penicillium brevicompactum TaxID=5074 RepID=A0A9W9R377_PENBR|nr:Telomere end binding protein [Penicillium brevicompactum]
MESIAQFPAPNAPGSLTKVPIAELSPDLEQPADKSILAVVTLVWPYSSAHKSLSLLLAEPDFRLRRSKGQVKVTFHGRVAEKVAESHVGIGDSICLGLVGSRFVSNEASQQTPGRSIAWDAHFETGVCLEVQHPSQAPLTVNIEHATSPTVTQEASLLPPATPNGKSIDTEPGTAASTGSWGSPAFLKPSRLSFGGIHRVTFNPFAEDDGFARYSLKRDDWRLVDEPDSPHEEEEVLDWEQALDRELDEASSEGESTDPATLDAAEVSKPEKDVGIQESSPPVFAKPSLELTGSILERRAEESNSALFKDINEGHVHLPTDTPKIRPIPSPGLPVPSPLVSDHAGLNDYFPSWTSSETQEIGSVATEIATPPVSFVEANELYAPSNDLQPPQFTGLAPVSEDTNIFDSDFPSHHGIGLNSGSHDLSSGQPDEAIDPFFSTVGGSGFTNTGDQVDHSGERASVFTETLHKAKNDSFESMDHELSARSGPTLEPIAHPINKTQLTHAQSPEESATDPRQQNFERDIESAEPEENVEDHSQSDIEPTRDAHSTADMDVDALYALESMRELRQMEDLDKRTFPQEKSDSGDEIDDSSQATGISRDESPYPDGDQMVDEEDRYDDQSEDDFESQDDYEEDAVQYDQDEMSLDGSEGEDSEEEHGFSPRPRPPQSQEIIVLDSDSDDEPAAETSEKPLSQSSEEADRESSRAGSADSALISNDANLALNVEEEEDDDEEDEGDEDEDEDENEQEEENSWDMGSKQGQLAASDDELEDDEDQEAGDDRGLNDEADALVHDSDKEAESSVQESSDQEENQVMEISAPFHDTDGGHRHITDPQSPPEAHRFDVQALDDNDQALDHDNRSLADTNQNDDQDSTAGSENRETGDEQDSHVYPQDHADKSYNVDGPADSHYPLSGELDTADSVIGQVSTQQVPETLDNSSFVETRFELVPASTQEAATLLGHSLESEFEITSTVTEQAPAGLDLTSQVLSSSGSEDLNRDATAHPDDQANQDSGSEDEAVSAMEFVETIENPERVPAAPEVVIPQGPFETPSVVVQPPTLDRDDPEPRSQLSDFPNLAALSNHQNALVDTLSIVQSVSPISRPKSGAKDWVMSVELTDPSIAGMTMNAQIFRRYKSAMPSLTEGSAVLLRSFKPQPLEGIITLVSVESSAWTVFDDSDRDTEINSSGSEERAYASGLRRWYTEVGSASVADYILQASIERESIDREPSPPNSEVPSELGSPGSRRGSRRRRSNQRVTIHELRDGTRYTEIGSPNNRNSSVHELRDGTLYANL